jgi:hypothetical protein
MKQAKQSRIVTANLPENRELSAQEMARIQGGGLVIEDRKQRLNGIIVEDRKGPSRNGIVVEERK